MYIVKMNKWGDVEKHSYVLGCWKTLRTAKKHGLEEMQYRGNKYEPQIIIINNKGFPFKYLEYESNKRKFI